MINCLELALITKEINQSLCRITRTKSHKHSSKTKDIPAGMMTTLQTVMITASAPRKITTERDKVRVRK